MAKFNIQSRSPKDRDFFISSDRYKHSFLTLGAGCHLLGCDFQSLYWQRPNHVLIGRFSSVSFLDFSTGLSHPYKNVVSTFPFSFPDVIDALGKSWKKPDFNAKQWNSHYQVFVGNDVWIGWQARIMGGVHIGDGAIIGNRSMVTKDVPPYAIVAGNPAKVIKYRFDQSTIKKFMAIKWWNWKVDKVFDNVPLFNDVEAFLEKHYSPELEKVPYETIQSLEADAAKKSEGFTIVPSGSLDTAGGG